MQLPDNVQKSFRKRKALWITLIVLVVFSVVFRLALPSLVRSHINKSLAKLDGYQGEIGRIGLHLWRGAFILYDIKLEKTDGKVPVPLYFSKKTDASIEWSELVHG